jgi:hypothetical protein
MEELLQTEEGPRHIEKILYYMEELLQARDRQRHNEKYSSF